MRYILILLSFAGLGASYGQAVPPDAKCPPDKVFTISEIPPVYKPGMDSMKLFFNEFIFPPSANGTVEMQTIICYQGDAIVTSIDNKTGVEIDNVSLKRWVFQMTQWKPGVQNGRYIGFQLKISLKVKDGEVKKVKCEIGTKSIESARHSPLSGKHISSLFV